MIPQKLELTNFLSYRDTAELDFQGIELACISGANGAGKSSILDAITWALFGRSRSRSDDDVVNRLAALNDEAAEVRLTFVLEGITYRIVRRKRAGRAVVLELQIAVDDGSWKTLSERKSRETQAQIEHLLRMNYDTFTNASFLLQGKADQFTTRTANQRKEILAELLGVTEWEMYREAAAERRKGEEGQSAIIEARLADIHMELEEKEERERVLAEAAVRRSAVSERLALQEQLLKQVRQTAAAIDQQKILVKNLAGNVQRIRRSLDSSKESLEKRQREQEDNAKILAEQAQISAGYAAWQTAEANVQSWQEKANQYNDMQQKMRPFEIAVAEMRSRLEQELNGLEARAEQVQRAVIKQPVLEEMINNDTVQLLDIENQLAELVELQGAFQEAQAKLQKLEGEKSLAEQEFSRLEKLEQRIQRAAEEKAAVLTNQRQAMAQLESLEAQLQAISQEQEAYLIAKAELDNLRGQQQPLRQDMETLKERIEQLESAELDSTCPTCGQPLSAAHRNAVLADLQQEGTEKGNQFRINKQRIAELDEETKRLQASFRQKERLERDQQSNQQRLAKAEARVNEIEQSAQEWQADGAAQLAALRRQLADDAAVQAQMAQVAQYQKQLEPMASLSSEQKKLQNELSTARASAQHMKQQIEEWEASGQDQLDSVRKQLAGEQFAQDARKSLAELDNELELLGYDPAAHQEAIADRDALADAPARYQALQQAKAAVVMLSGTIAELTARIADQEQELDDQRQQLESAEIQLQSLIEGSSDLREMETAVAALREEEISAVRTVSVAQQKLDVLQDLQNLQDELEAKKTALTLRIKRLKFLEKSCGRQGVQALLIEHALPEIEERANQLIERLTDGAMRIYFDTQRKLKTRDALAETLDIRIEDKDGVRPYDNYSGGEQFRVNFAIRLALSQLLAHRAGARLQTLVIDEGFGSQDPQGRQRLVEAINAVRNEFACILVITHIAELRDAFSTRIEIQKTLNGSTIRVV
jgi:exonuclease SbcC